MVAALHPQRRPRQPHTVRIFVPWNLFGLNVVGGAIAANDTMV
jgi:hypothetical protein